MKVLLDTNTVIHREAATVVDEDIGVVLRWLDILRHTKCIHSITAEPDGSFQIAFTYLPCTFFKHILSTGDCLDSVTAFVANANRTPTAHLESYDLKITTRVKRMELNITNLAVKTELKLHSCAALGKVVEFQ